MALIAARVAFVVGLVGEAWCVRLDVRLEESGSKGAAQLREGRDLEERAGASTRVPQLREALAAKEGRDAQFKSTCAGDGGHLWTEYQELQRTGTDRSLVYTCREGSCSHGVGIGNQLRGITVAFYLAVLTRRAFYIDWGDSDVANNKIDWHLPGGALPRGCKNAAYVGEGFGCTRRDACKEINTVLSQENVSCLHMQTNAVPSIWWEHMATGPHSDLFAPVHKAISQPEFAAGCALQFLFDFSGMQQALAERRTLKPGSGYVALHMRLGDWRLRRASGVSVDPELNSNEKEQIRAALLCARGLAKDSSTEGQRCQVLIASDSLAARLYASTAAVELNVSACENEFEPKHSDGAVSAIDKWSVWGDFLTILGAAGLVSAGGAHSSAESSDLFTNGISDYSQVPAQYTFMPFSRQRVVPASLPACKPVTSASVQAVI